MRHSNQMQTVTVFRNVSLMFLIRVHFFKGVTYSKRGYGKYYVIPMVRIVERDVHLFIQYPQQRFVARHLCNHCKRFKMSRNYLKEVTI